MTAGDATPPGCQSASTRPIDRRSLLASLPVLVSGCGGESEQDTETASATRTATPTSTPQRLVVLAGTLPLSGPLSRIGTALREGLFTWAREINDAGGLRGRTVDLRIDDDEGDPDVAREAYHSLVEEANVLIAPYGSRATAAVLDIVASAGVPCIANTAGDRALWSNGREWTVQLLNPVDTFLHSLLAVTARTGAESIAFCYRDDPFTSTVMDGASERARERGWTVSTEVTYTSIDGLDAKLRAAVDPAPDLLVGGGFQPGAEGGGFLPDALALSRAYEQVGGTALVNWAIGASYHAFRERRGAAAELETGVTGWKPYVDYPGNAAFADRYREQVGKPPDAHAAQGYATGQVLAAAVAQAKTLEPEAVRDELFALRTTTVFGRYRVDERGLQVGKTNVVVQWQDGAPTVVWPERWQSGELIEPTR